MKRRFTRLLAVAAAVGVPVAIELLIAVVLANDLRTTLTRLTYVLLIPLGVFVLLGLAQHLIQRQVLLMGLIQAVTGVAITIVGAGTGVTTMPFAEPISTGLAIAGPAIVVTSVYLIVVDLRFLDLQMIRPAQPHHAEHHTQHLGNGDMAYARTFADIPHDRELFEDCLQAVSTRDVHFIATFARGELQFFVDVLASPRLDVDTAPHGAACWRKRIERAGRQLMALDGRIAAAFGRIEKGVLARTMLDVEHGALFLYRLRQGHYVIGATLRQVEILRAQRKLDALALKHQRFHYGSPDTVLRSRDLVSDYPTVTRWTSCLRAAQLMAEHNAPSVLVLDPLGRAVGELTGGQLLQAAVPKDVGIDPPSARYVEAGHAKVFAEQLSKITVGDLLPTLTNLPVARPATTALEAAGLMVAADTHIVAVADETALAGVIRLNSLIDQVA